MIGIGEDMLGIGGGGGKVEGVVRREEFLLCWDEMVERRKWGVKGMEGRGNMLYKEGGRMRGKGFGNGVVFWRGEGWCEWVMLGDRVRRWKGVLEVKVEKYGEGGMRGEEVKGGELVEVVWRIRRGKGNKGRLGGRGIR